MTQADGWDTSLDETGRFPATITLSTEARDGDVVTIPGSGRRVQILGFYTGAEFRHYVATLDFDRSFEGSREAFGHVAIWLQDKYTMSQWRLHHDCGDNPTIADLIPWMKLTEAGGDG